MERKDRMGIHPLPNDDHISLLRFSKSACGVDFLLNTAEISAVDGVREVHHLHIWPLSTTVTAMTTHVLISNPADMDRVINDIRLRMQHLGISHSTIETETKVSSAEKTEADC